MEGAREHGQEAGIKWQVPLRLYAYGAGNHSTNLHSIGQGASASGAIVLLHLFGSMFASHMHNDLQPPGCSRHACMQARAHMRVCLHAGVSAPVRCTGDA
eukprot:366344-Chlamydomonas_euryale.AAC.5